MATVARGGPPEWEPTATGGLPMDKRRVCGLVAGWRGDAQLGKSPADEVKVDATRMLPEATVVSCAARKGEATRLRAECNVANLLLITGPTETVL